jgi:pimeloyl-ACP methyl ester carboxylesterase
MQAEPSAGLSSRFVSSQGLGSIILLLVFATTATAAKPERESIVLRGRAQTFYHLAAAASSDVQLPPVLFIPGDGGCNRAARNMVRMISSLGYEVFGLDVRHYLSTSTHGRKVLTQDQMAADMEEAIRKVAGPEHRPVLLAGWSQGATMVVLAAARMRDRHPLQGVLTVALPEAGTLGWRRLDTLRLLFRKAPHEPAFQVAPLLPEVAPTPLWMVYGTQDRFTAASIARRFTALARRPRRSREIEGGNHTLDNQSSRLKSSLEAGLAWLSRPGPAPQTAAAPAQPVGVR